MIYTWVIKSTDLQRQYLVVKECPINCRLKCRECCICVHSYTCTCPDALIRYTICKHIHAVVKMQQYPVNTVVDKNEQECLHDESHIKSIVESVKMPKEDIELERKAILRN